MKKKLLSLLLMMVLAIPISFGLSGVEAYADDGDYIKINNVDDLYNVRNDLSANYKLMKDIDMTEVVAEGGKYNYSGKGWEPLGVTTQTEFTGEFDGNGHTISGLSITETIYDENSEKNSAGLFWINSGTIHHLKIRGTIKNNTSGYGYWKYAGFIAGINKGSISNCSTNGTVKGHAKYECSEYGSIAGLNYGSVTECIASGEVTNGYVGYAGIKYAFVGGICGENWNGGKISCCVNTANVCANSLYTNGNGAACGIGCSGTISNCYNVGTITGRYDYPGYGSGYYCAAYGIAKAGNLTNCYNVGPISVRSGGSVGGTTVTNCYYLDSSGSDSKAIQVNETQLTMKSTFVGFDFDNTWVISSATDYKYPQLRNNMQDPNKHVDIIEWKTQPTKIDFYTDEEIDPTGGVFTAYYIDDTHEDIEITKDMLSGYDMTQLGVQTVTVTFREGSLTYDILTSTRPEVKSLTLETMPDKTEFARGTAFDFTGATAKVEYVNGKTEIIPIPTEECTGGNIEQSGTYTITFEKFGKSLTFDVKVVPVKPTGIRIASLPDKTTYIEGQSLDLTGLVVKLDYNSGKTETITDYTVGEYTNTVGTKEISVSYEDFSTSFNVEFVEKKLTNIMVTTQPTKAKYVVGEAFDPTGMVVKAVYDNGISEEITDYTVSELTDATGWQTLTVSYEGKTTTIKVMVEAKELVSIFVAQMPAKTTYIEGQAFDPEGLIVKANYNNVLEEEITDYTLSGTTLNKVGESKITVLYEGMTATFNVNVVEKQLVRITVTPPTKTEYIAGEEFDETGMVVNAVYDNGKSEAVTGYTVSGFGDTEEDNVVMIEYGGKTSAFMVTVHTPDNKWTVTQAPTCTTGGTQELHCANCGKLLKTEELEALGHDWSEWETVDAPNCTDKGSQKRTCSRCNEVEYKDVDPNGHTWRSEYTVDKEPSCTEEGSESQHCSECGVINPESVRAIDKLPHELGDWMVTKEATCAVAGVRQRVCAHCEYLETEEIPATGNHEFGEWKVTKEATCTEVGSKDRECAVCHKVETEAIPAIGSHKYSEWKVTKKPTVDSEGSKERICSVCGHKETEVIKKLPAPDQPAVDPVNQTGTDGTALGEGASAQAAEAAIAAMTSDNDLPGTVFNKLQLKSSKQTNTSISLSWKKVSKATSYVIYGNKCGKTNKMQRLTATNGKSKKFTKVLGKKVKKGTYYKFMIVALDKNNNVVSSSKIIHVATKGGNVGNVGKVTTKAKNNKVSIRKGKTFKLAGKQTAAVKKLKVKKHRAVTYESSNPKIATVSKKGVIKGKKKGNCYVYAYAQNGVFAKIKVTVK